MKKIDFAASVLHKEFEKGDAYNSKRVQAVRLKAKGLNHTQIAKQLGVARYTVIRWLDGVSQ